MRKLLPILLLLVTTSWATISPIGGGKVNALSSPATITYSPTSGNTVVLFVATTGTSTPYCYDNNLNMLTVGPGQYNFNSPSLLSYIEVAGNSVTSFTCVFAAVDTVSVTLYEYSGSLGFNLIPNLTACSGTIANNACTGSGTSASMTVTTDDANDYIVCGFSDTSNAFSVVTGTSRENETSKATLVMLDNTVASAGSVTCAASLTSAAWAAAVIELRSVTPPVLIWSMVSFVPAGYIGNTNCPQPVPGAGNPTNTCTWPVPMIGSGHPLIVMMDDQLDSAGSAQITLTGIFDCTSPPCNSGNTINTWTLPGASCQGYATDGAAHTQSTDCGYVLSSTSGAKYITATRNTHGTNERWGPTFFEIAAASGGWVLDTVASASQNTNSTTHTMTSSTLTGTNDVILQGFSGEVGPIVVTPQYSQAACYSHFCYAMSLNTASGTAPTWTGAGASSGAGSAIAFRILPPVGHAHAAIF